jgi:hypothetical protein
MQQKIQWALAGLLTGGLLLSGCRQPQQCEREAQKVWRHATVQNPDGIGSGLLWNYAFAFGESCRFAVAGSFQPLKFDDTLTRYINPPDLGFPGSDTCPDGTILRIDLDAIRQLQAGIQERLVACAMLRQATNGAH